MNITKGAPGTSPHTQPLTLTEKLAEVATIARDIRAIASAILGGISGNEKNYQRIEEAKSESQSLQSTVSHICALLRESEQDLHMARQEIG